MRRLALVVAYDGAAFHGWQRQPGLRTVQGDIEAALSAVLEEDVRVSGAGRTDTGVHARGQVASFETSSALPARAVQARLAKRLAADVQVRSAHDAAADFDARRTATARRYAYRLAREHDVLFRGISVRPRERWVPDRWQRAALSLEGQHDCSSFESAGSPRAEKTCRIVRASFSPWEAGVVLHIVADRFLYHMVRNVIGTLLAAGRAKDPAAHVRGVIAARDRAAAGACVPPHGLSLEQVFYPVGVWS